MIEEKGKMTEKVTLDFKKVERFLSCDIFILLLTGRARYT